MDRGKEREKKDLRLSILALLEGLLTNLQRSSYRLRYNGRRGGTESRWNFNVEIFVVGRNILLIGFIIDWSNSRIFRYMGFVS